MITIWFIEKQLITFQSMRFQTHQLYLFMNHYNLGEFHYIIRLHILMKIKVFPTTFNTNYQKFLLLSSSFHLVGIFSSIMSYFLATKTDDFRQVSGLLVYGVCSLGSWLLLWCRVETLGPIFHDWGRSYEEHEGKHEGKTRGNTQINEKQSHMC